MRVLATIRFRAEESFDEVREVLGIIIDAIKQIRGVDPDAVLRIERADSDDDPFLTQPRLTGERS